MLMRHLEMGMAMHSTCQEMFAKFVLVVASQINFVDVLPVSSQALQ
jgi:hypothetical protein